MSDRNCINCNFRLTEIMNYCPNCGAKQGGIKVKLSGMKAKMGFQMKNKVDSIKSSVDSRISEYLNRIDNEPEFQLAGRNVPEHRKTTIKNALLKFQDKLNVESDADFNEWLEDLELRLEDENCIICFQKWVAIDDQILVCKFCQSGGHSTHISAWIKQHNFCPLCREALKERDLLKVGKN